MYTPNDAGFSKHFRPWCRSDLLPFDDRLVQVGIYHMNFEKIDRFLRPLSHFIAHESTAGLLLFGCALVALGWANSPFSAAYFHLWEHEFAVRFAGYTVANSLHHWINDGLMAMFFFVVGLELKREMMAGELSSLRTALLPMAAAIGGMLVPTLIFVACNPRPPHVTGWGIPMATDIAFVLGILALLGKRVPVSLKIFLTALAIVDDLGAVLVIAVFYTSDISVVNLGVGGVFLALLLLANALGVRTPVFYGIAGIGGLWLAFLLSGVHATIAGVLAALTIPARPRIDERGFTQRLRHYLHEFEHIKPNDVTLLEPAQMHVLDQISRLIRAADTPLQRLEHALYPLVSFVVMPVFALANAGISFTTISADTLLHPVSVGIFLGLLLGKGVGVVGACWVFTRLGWASFPGDMQWGNIYGVGVLAGMGFTMSLFITTLAYEAEDLIIHAKMGILVASLLAGIVGYMLLKKSLPPAQP
jgi:NhaA family Na+:H+ antiporter